MVIHYTSLRYILYSRYTYFKYNLIFQMCTCLMNHESLSCSPCVSMLSREAVRVRRLAAHLWKAMSTDRHASSLQSIAVNMGAPTAAIIIIGDEILKVTWIFYHSIAVL